MSLPWLEAERAWTVARPLATVQAALAKAPRAGDRFVLTTPATPSFRYRARGLVRLAAEGQGTRVTVALGVPGGEALVTSVVVAGCGMVFAALILLNAWVFGLNAWPLLPMGVGIGVIVGSAILFRVEAERLTRSLASHLETFSGS